MIRQRRRRKALAKLNGRGKREHALQKSIAEYLTVALPPNAWFSSIENSTERGDTIGRIQQIERKARGCVTGIPDLVILYNDGLVSSSFWLEIKTATGVVDPEQTDCHNRIHTAGGIIAVVRSAKEVEQLLIYYGIPIRARVA